MKKVLLLIGLVLSFSSFGYYPDVEKYVCAGKIIDGVEVKFFEDMEGQSWEEISVYKNNKKLKVEDSSLDESEFLFKKDLSILIITQKNTEIICRKIN